MKAVAVLIIVACAFAQTFGLRIPTPRLNERILGGEDASEGEFPYQLSFQIYSNYHTCGASVITPIVALTSAYCTAGGPIGFFSVRAGSHIYENGGVVVNVDKVFEHPDFNPETHDYNVAVLHLAQHLVLGPNINMIPIQGIDEQPADGSPAVVTGWGILSEGGDTPYKLQKVSVNRVNSIKCNKAYQELKNKASEIITDRMMCYQGPGYGFCSGDLGGPLVANGKQVGIVSWAAGCARVEYPGVYTNIAERSIRTHITSHIL